MNTGKAFKEGMRFSVLPRKNRFDVYVDFGSHPEYVVTFDVPSFGDYANETVFMNVEAGLYCSGRARVRGVSFSVKYIIVQTSHIVIDNSGIIMEFCYALCYNL